MPKINSLYELIKQKSQEKNRSLRVIADWDDCLQPLKPAIFHKMSQSKVPFSSFFEIFWENCNINPSSAGGFREKDNLEHDEKLRSAIKEYHEIRERMKKDPNYFGDFAKTFYGTEGRFSVPLTSIAKELLQCLKEGLVSELVVISSFKWEDTPEDRKIDLADNDGKRNKVERTFGRFPITKFELTEVKENKEGKLTPYRWDRIKEICPDFDIFVDDSTAAISGTRKKFHSEDKTYVFPDYAPTRKLKAPDIYHVKTTVSDLTDEDFVKAAEEYKAQKEQELATRRAQQPDQERERESLWKQSYLYLAFASGLVGGWFVCFLINKKNKMRS